MDKEKMVEKSYSVDFRDLFDTTLAKAIENLRWYEKRFGGEAGLTLITSRDGDVDIDISYKEAP